MAWPMSLDFMASTLKTAPPLAALIVVSREMGQGRLYCVRRSPRDRFRAKLMKLQLSGSPIYSGPFQESVFLICVKWFLLFP